MESINNIEQSRLEKPKFNVNMIDFLESYNVNSSLNRKVFIDKDGEIRNYSGHIKSFGNVNNSSLTLIVKSKEFQKIWIISNDQIRNCYDCKYRYICFNPGEVISQNYGDFRHERKIKCYYESIN